MSGRSALKCAIGGAIGAAHSGARRDGRYFMDIGAGFDAPQMATCQWPEEGGGKCGRPTKARSSYCPDHHARAYERPTPGAPAIHWRFR